MDDQYYQPHDGEGTPQLDVQVNENQYEEVSEIRTKPGDDHTPAVRETQFDSERPTSVDTIDSGNILMHTDEDVEVQLAQLSTPGNSVGTTGARTEGKGIPPNFLSRPLSSGSEGPGAKFQFEKPSTKQFDLVGPRKGSTITVWQQEANVFTAADTEQPRELPVSGMDDSDGASWRPTAPAPTESKRTVTSKKRKRVHHDTAPTEYPHQQHYRPDLSQMNDQGAHSLNEADDEPSHMQITAYGTPELDAQSMYHQVEYHSPHTQLHDELEIATSRVQRPRTSPERQEDKPLPTIADDVSEEQGETCQSRSGHAIQYGQLVTEQHPETPSFSRDADRLAMRGDAQAMGPPSATLTSRQLTGSADAVDSASGANRRLRPTKLKSVNRENSVISGGNNSDLEDLLQVFAYKLRESEKAAVEKAAAERLTQNEELQQLMSERQVMQEELESVRAQHETTAVAVEKQKTKISSYESKFGMFKTYIEGLGKDFNTVKRDMTETKRKTEKLLNESRINLEEQSTLFEHLNACSEKATKVKNKAFIACREAVSKMQAATLRNEYLEQQLSEKVGLLAEERDRRSSLEQQLTIAKTADESVVRLLKANHDGVMDKLYDIHATMEDVNDTETVEMIEKCLAAVQALNSQQASSVDELAVVKGLVETLSGHASTQVEHVKINEVGNCTGETIVLQAVHALKEEIMKHEALVSEIAGQRGSVAVLQEEVKGCNIRITEAGFQLNASHIRETVLVEKNEDLEARINAYTNKQSSRDGELATIQDENMLLQRELEKVKSDLSSKSEELQALKFTNSSLHQQLRELQLQVETVPPTMSDFSIERAALEKVAKEKLEHVQKEISESAQVLINHERAEAANKLKSLEYERDQLKGQLKTSISIQEHAHKKSGRKNDESSSAKLECLGTELRAKEAQLREAEERVAGAAEQIGDLQHSVEELQAAKETMKSQTEQQESEATAAIDEMEKKLAAANQAANKHDKGLDDLRKSCDTAIEEAKEKSSRQLEAQRRRADEAEGELQLAKEKQEQYHKNVQDAWHTDKEQHDAEKAALRRQITETQALRDDAIDTTKSELQKDFSATINEQVEMLGAQVMAANERALRAEQELANRLFNDVGDEVGQPNGVTPAAAAHAMAPSRPRKKVDRTSNTTVEVGSVPAPEILRPTSRQGPAIKPARSRPSEQCTVSEITDPFVHGSNMSAVEIPESQPEPEHSFRAIFSGSDEMLDGHAFRQREIVGETQFKDSQPAPSFAAFHSSLGASQLSKSGSVLSEISLPSLSAENVCPQDDFAIHDESRDVHSHHAEESFIAEAEVQDSLDANDSLRYTYHKSFPAPNSASKMVPLDYSGDIHHGKRDSGIDRYLTEARTPEYGSDHRESSFGGIRPDRMAEMLAPHSSSPNYVHAKGSSGRRMNTYTTPGGSGTRRSSRTHSNTHVTDPRREHHNQPATDAHAVAGVKRGPPQIVDGYEHARKRRVKHGNGTSCGLNDHSLRSQVQTQPSELSRLTSLGPGRPRQSMPQSQLRSSSTGVNHRMLRGSTVKMSRSDEMNARFDQALSGR